MTPTALARITSAFRTSAALGIRPATLPLMVLVPLGAFLGPLGIGLISLRVLLYLDTVVSVALATLGVFVGIALGTERGKVRRLIVASTAEGTVTLLVVAAAAGMLLTAWQMPAAIDPWIIAAALGVAAAASAAPFVGDTHDRPRRIAARVADLDDVLPIALGSIVLGFVSRAASGITTDIGLTILVGAGIGLAGWLLFERAEGAERGVFVVGTLALLGGCAAYLGASPLLAGMAAGFIWARTPGRTDQIAAADLRKVEHPLVVLLLLIAGAGLQPSVAGIWVFAPYVVFRTAGKLVGGWIASRVAPGVAPADLGAYLITPGVLGIAFILNFQQVAPDLAPPLVFAVTLGAVISEVLALIVTPRHHAA